MFFARNLVVVFKHSELAGLLDDWVLPATLYDNSWVVLRALTGDLLSLALNRRVLWPDIRCLLDRSGPLSRTANATAPGQGSRRSVVGGARCYLKCKPSTPCANEEPGPYRALDVAAPPVPRDLVSGLDADLVGGGHRGGLGDSPASAARCGAAGAEGGGGEAAGQQQAARHAAGRGGAGGARSAAAGGGIWTFGAFVRGGAGAPRPLAPSTLSPLNINPKRPEQTCIFPSFVCGLFGVVCDSTCF